MSRILKTIKMGALLLAVTLVVAACSSNSAPVVDEVTVATAIAQTVEAQALVEAMVQQTVAAQLAAQQPASDPVQPPPAQDPVQPVVDPNAPDVADPNSGIEPIKPAADPNIASGTPQLKVIYSSINVRLGPGTDCRPISALLKDSVVPVKAINQDGKWFEISLPNGQNGWVADSVTDLVVAADLAKVPVSSTPYCAPPPTATATSTAVNTPLPTSTTAAPVNTPPATSTTAAVPSPTTAAPAIPATIQIVNNSTTDIWNIFIDLSSDPNWPSSGDRLGTNNFLFVGDQRSFDVPAGEYDLMALDEFDNVVSVEVNIIVSGSMQWDIR